MGVGKTITEAVNLNGFQFVRGELEWDEQVQVFSAINTMKGALVNSGDYVLYDDHSDGKVCIEGAAIGWEK